jgi:cbb3-type cytochrome oxidase subunit 1
MPTVTRWYLRTALVFLVLAFATGVLLAARAPLGLSAALAALTPVFFHLIFVGFVTQLIFGVVFWLFPKHTREQPRGSEPLAWAAFWLLNGGLVLRVVAEPAQAGAAGPVWGWLLVASAAAQWAAALLFAANTWARVKER